MNSAVSLAGSNVHPATLNSAARPRSGKQTRSDGRINEATFEQFLYWLGPDPESAGQKYELIRDRLIMMFRARRCVVAEDLADITFERVARRMADLTTEFTGDPARYFYGVAKKVLLEYQHELTTRSKRAGCLSPASAEDEDLEKLLKQLDDALGAIRKSDRDLILGYYTDGGRNKIDHRRALARQIGIGPNALRLRVFRIRREIKNYILRTSPDAILVQ